MIDKITVIIPTYKRYKLLYRLLKYFESYNLQMKIMILDSTPYEPNNEKIIKMLTMKNILWKKYKPHASGLEKIPDGLNNVNTEYSVICADDDFLIPPSLVRCADFLNYNSDYLSAQGYFYSHTNAETAIKRGYSMNRLYPKMTTLFANTGIERFTKQYIDMTSNVFSFFGLYRTNIHQLIWDYTKKFARCEPYAELLPCAGSEILGNIKILPIFYSSREPHDIQHKWKQEEIYRKIHSYENTEVLNLGLSKILSKADDISLDEAKTFINKVDFRPSFLKDQDKLPLNNHKLGKYIKSIPLLNKYKMSNLSFRSKIKRLIVDRKGCPKEIYPNYYDDFIKVKNAVLTANVTNEDINPARDFIPEDT